jgi:hypothetical protein
VKDLRAPWSEPPATSKKWLGFCSRR